MRFSDIPGLEFVKKGLFSSIEKNHVAHAQLFTGNSGSANLALALGYSTLLNCENPTDSDACGQCSSCQKAIKFIHPDIHYVYPVCSIDKKEGISKSFLPEWRSFLLNNPYSSVENWGQTIGGDNKQLNISREESRHIIKDLSLKAFEGKYKIMIIWRAEFLHPSAANGILKILEEPPENTIFLLVVNDREQLLTTILSRTQFVNIPAFSDSEISGYLMTKENLDPQKAKQIAHISSGDLNHSLHLIHNLQEDSHEMFYNWMKDCYSKDFTKLVEWADKFNALNKTEQRSLFQYGINLMRETLVSIYGATDIRRVATDKEEVFVTNF